MTLFVCVCVLLVYAPDISILQLLALAMAASAGSQFRLYVRNITYAATKQVSCQHFPVLVLHVLFKSCFLSFLAHNSGDQVLHRSCGRRRLH